MIQIAHAGEHVAQWDFQNNSTRTSPPGPAFVLEVPLRNLLTSICDFVQCDRNRAKGLMTAILFCFLIYVNRPFATNDHMVQSPPYWRARSLLFPHWDVKTKRPSPIIIMSLPSSMADFVLCDRLLQKAYYV